LIIECDEFNHKDRNKKYELERQFFIENELNATFIRFNPDDNNFNILDVISKIHYNMCNYKNI
jgi:very-short-patch-repair endonuclease